MIELANKANKPVLVDPKGNDFSRYQGATLVTPNKSEFEAIAGLCGDDAAFESAGVELMQQHDLKNLLITRSEKGMTLIEEDQVARHRYQTWRRVSWSASWVQPR